MTNKNSKGLGRGIDALFTEFAEFDKVDSSDERVQQIELSEIRPNPYQPRRRFDEDALNELADSIKQSGVFQPIILRASSAKGYELIAGERRFRASKLAGKTTIPAIVREFNEEDMMQVAVLENLQREDLSALEEAEAYNMLMKNLKLTQEEVALRLGKSRPYIANYLRLLGLPEEVKEMLQQNDISMGQARTLLGLKDKKQILKIAKKVVKENLTVRQIEQLVSQMNEPKKEQEEKGIKKPLYIRESEERLMDKFGTTVVINDKNEKGKIEIEYLSTEDLTRILDLLEIQFD
ncbi:MAG: ParB/RepB/Spo0J family partition protein [Pisciglobus halotolerans]|nr:ParB/RepB/Spo0J family partition protein [Pisciglobus halotolerans]